jgi:adenylate cyclase
VRDIGYRQHSVYTAIGDTVNVAARLQAFTAQLDCELLISEETYRTAGHLDDLLPSHDVAIPGRDVAVRVRAAARAGDLFDRKFPPDRCLRQSLPTTLAPER